MDTKKRSSNAGSDTGRQPSPRLRGFLHCSNLLDPFALHIFLAAGRAPVENTSHHIAVWKSLKDGVKTAQKTKKFDVATKHCSTTLEEIENSNMAKSNEEHEEKSKQQTACAKELQISQRGANKKEKSKRTAAFWMKEQGTYNISRFASELARRGEE